MNKMDKMDVVYSIVFYSLCSCGMMIFNKLAIHEFSLPITLTILQFLFLIVVITIPFYKRINILGFKDTLRWCFVSFLFSVMLSSSMYSFRYVTLGTILIFNNTRTLPSVVIEKFVNRIGFDFPIILSLIGILFGIAIYAYHDMTFSVIGYILCLINMISSVLERVSQKYLISVYGIPLTDISMMLYNNFFGIIWLSPFVFILKENTKWNASFEQLPSKGWVFIMLSMFCGIFICYTGFRLQRRVSATTFLVINNANKIGVLLFSYFVVGEKYTKGMQIGLFFSISCCFIYGYLRNHFNEKNNQNLHKNKNTSLIIDQILQEENKKFPP